MKQIKIEKLYTIQLTSSELNIIKNSFTSKSQIYVENENEIKKKLINDIDIIMKKL